MAVEFHDLLDVDNVITNVKVYGVEESIVASGYSYAHDNTFTLMKDRVKNGTPSERDFQRAVKLAGTSLGSGHSQFLVGCIVQFDLTLSEKAWVQAQRYHFLDFVSSCSLMHRAMSLGNEYGNYNGYTDVSAIQNIQNKKAEYDRLKDEMIFQEDIEKRKKLKERLDDLELQILYNIPLGFSLTARMTTNYQQLRTIYWQRREHKLPEWHTFCHWIETLPYAELIVGAENSRGTKIPVRNKEENN